MDEAVKSYVNRESFAADTAFILAEVKKGADAITQVNATLKGLSGAKGFKDVADAAQLATDKIKEANDSMKAADTATKQLFQSEEKLAAVQSNTAKATAENRVATQQINKERKIEAELALATEGSIDKLRARLKQLNVERNRQNSETEEGRKREAELNKEIDAQTEILEKRLDAYSRQKMNIGNYQGSAKIIVEALEKEIAKLKQLEAQKVRVANAGASPIGFAQHSNQAATVTAQSGGDFSKFKLSATQTTAELKKLDEQLEQSRVVVEGFRRVTDQPLFLKAAASAGDAIQEFRTFQKVLVNLEATGYKDSEMAVQLRKRLAELKDTIADAKEEVKALSSDTRSFDLFAGSVSFAADAMQAAAGSAALFGASEEKTEEVIKRVVAIQSIANGIKGIANELTTRGTAANKAYNYVMTQFSVVTDKASSSAQKFNAALKVGLIGIAVAAIIKLVQAFSDTGSEVKKAAAEIETFNTAVENSVSSTNRFLESRKQQISLLVEDAKRRGASEAEISKIVADGYNEEAASLKALGAQRRQELNDLTKDADARLGTDFQNSQMSQFMGRATTAYTILTRIESFKLTPKFQDLSEDSKQLVENLANAAKSVNDISENQFKAEYNAQSAAAQQITKDAEKDRDRRRKAAEELKKLREKQLQESLEMDKRNAAAERQILIDAYNERIRLNQLILEDEESTLSQQLKANENISASKKALAQLEYATAIESEKTIQDGKIVVIKKTNSEILLASQKLNFQLQKIDEETIASAKRSRTNYVNELKQAYDDANAEAIASIEEAGDNALNAENAAHAKSISALNEKLRTGKISQKRYNEEREKLEIDHAIRLLKIQIDNQKEMLAYSFLTDDERKEALDKLADLEMQLDDKITQHFIDNQNKKRDKFLKVLDEFQSYSSQVFDFIGGMINANATRRINILQEEKDAIDRNAAAEIERINATTISEQEKAAKIIIVNARVQSQKEAIERRERQIKIEQARFDKSVAIFNIILSTARNIAAATNPLGKILAAVSGAAQLAVAIATPLPRFFKGKKKGEPVGNTHGVVNDHPDGRTTEIVEHPDGSFTEPVGRNVIMPINKDDIVHADKDAWMADMMAAAHKDAFKYMGGPPIQKKDDFVGNAMALQIRLLKQIANKKELTIGASDSGMIALHKWGASQIKYLEENTNWQ